jgi:hypothetical protein
MREIRYKNALTYYEKKLQEYDEYHRSLAFRFRFYFYYARLKSVLISNRATLFEFERVGHSKFAHRNVQFKAHRLNVLTEATGSVAWDVILNEPDIVELTLGCSKCGYLHIICERYSTILFDDYDGAYCSSWFELFNQRICDKSKNVIVCQSCKNEGVPIIRTFPHRPSLAKPKHPGSPDDPAYADPPYPKLP